MAERPILFSSNMVRAILDGTKTQTRRVGDMRGADRVSWQKCETHWWKGKPPQPYEGWVAHVDKLSGLLLPLKCPYGVPGDRLWVRETLRRKNRGFRNERWVYDADGSDVILDRSDPRVAPMIAWAHHKEGDVCVSIHMPRWASRLTLEVTEVRVERLQDISGRDAVAEGIPRWPHQCACEFCSTTSVMCTATASGIVMCFAELWDSINGKRAGCAWADSPWVWVVAFRKVVGDGR